jgi:hypothetical protein
MIPLSFLVNNINEDIVYIRYPHEKNVNCCQIPTGTLLYQYILRTHIGICNREEKSEKSMEISLFLRFVIIVTIIVSIVDIVGFYAIWKYGIRVTTWWIVLLMIIGTIIPITINFWYWLEFKQG